MELKELNIENFGSFETAKLRLDQPGLILVTGQNRDAKKADSNGSGKSLLFDALCWCLWGDIPRDLEDADDVVRHASNKNCAVSVIIQDEGHTYKVSRHRKDLRTAKPNDLIFTMDDGPPIGESIKATQVQIDRLIGFDFNTFCAMMPGTGVKAASMTDKEIKILLESLLQTDQLSEAYQSSLAKAQELRSSLEKLVHEEDLLNKALADIDNEITSLKQLEESFETTRAAEMLKLTEEIANTEDEIAEFDLEVAGQADVESALEAEKADREFLIASREEELKELKSRISSVDPIITGAIKNIDRLAYERLVLYQENDIFDLLGPTCSTCKQAVSSEAKHTVQDKNRKRVVDIDHQISNEKSIYDTYSDMQKGWIRERQTVADALKTETETKNFTIDLLTKRLFNIKLAAVGKNHATRRCQELKDSLQVTAAKVNNISSLIVDKLAKKALLETDLDVILIKKKELEDEEKLCKFWVNGFSPAGLRSFMLEYITPILNDRAKYYADLLTNGDMEVVFTTKTKQKNGITKDAFNIIVKHKHGAKKYNMSSGGEKARADLVIAMAIGDLASYRTAKQLPWRFLDEPFERVDDSGTDAIIRLLRDQQSRYKTVFVITHKASFKSLFSQTVEVVKENGVSTILESSNE